MSTTEPLFLDYGTDFGGNPVYTPQVPGQPPATPVSTAPPPVPAPTAQPFVDTSPPVAIAVPTPRRAPTDLPVPVVPGVPRHAPADYAEAARALLPRGRAWSDDPDSVQAKVLAAIGAVFSRSDAALNGLLAGSVPGQPTPMLPEWEAALGLPDPCAGEAPSIAQRLDQVRGRFVGAGGQSREHIADFAAALGFTIAITNFAPFRAGRSTVGNPVAGDEWSFVWGVRVTATTGALPVDVLMCELQAIKPAETTLILLT